MGSFVVTDSPNHLGFLVGEPDYCKHGCVCFAISGPWHVCLGPFTYSTTAATGKCFCIHSCSETVINVKEGLMKFRSKPCDALQREKNSKLKHSTKILMR